MVRIALPMLYPRPPLMLSTNFMRLEQAASEVVDSVRFSFYTAEEIRKISVKKITKPDLLDSKSAPIPDGLYDPALGPINDADS